MTTLTLATWNVNSLKVRLEHVLSWLGERDDIDALVLQETKLTDDKFPQGELALAGWESVFYGQPTYNGVALLTRPDRVTVTRQRKAVAMVDASAALHAVQTEAVSTSMMSSSSCRPLSSESVMP